MITLKRQPKVYYKKQKSPQLPQFSFLRLFSFRILFGIFFTTLLISSIHVPAQSRQQQAEPKNVTSALKLEPLTVLPTQIPITPPLLPLEALVDISPSPEQAATNSAETPTDYCVDVPVILYHHIQPISMASLLGHAQLTVDSTMFDSQIRDLKEKGYNALSADDLVNALYHHQSLPPKSIIITIDDGYDDNYTYAFMTAKKYQMIINFMIPTKLIGKPGYMNWDHLREIHANEYARIYNHTATHAPLGYILKNQIYDELITSKEDFRRELGFNTGIFTYPYGSYNALAIEVLKEQGFVAAFTTDDGQTHCLSNIMQLKRKRVGNAPISTYGY